METILEKLEQLSTLARETSGGSFVIQHIKETGKWKVVFGCIMTNKKDKLQPTTFEQAIDEAIVWISTRRRKCFFPEIFTLYKP
jgi:hypothetical protein